MTYYEHHAWRWLKSELATRLGEDAMAEVWAEHARLVKIDRVNADLVSAQRVLHFLETQRAVGGSTTYHRNRMIAAHKNLARAQAKVDALKGREGTP